MAPFSSLAADFFDRQKGRNQVSRLRPYVSEGILQWAAIYEHQQLLIRMLMWPNCSNGGIYGRHKLAFS